MEINGKRIEKAAKTIAKSDNLFLGRSGEHYYICNGYWLIKLHRQHYNEIFRPASARFVELEDGEGANTRNKKKIPNKSEPIDFKNIIGENNCTDESKVVITDYIRRTSKWNERIVDNNDTMMIVNNEFMEIMENLMGYTYWFGTPGNELKPIFTDFDQDIAGLVLPIRPQPNSYCVVKAA